MKRWRQLAILGVLVAVAYYFIGGFLKTAFGNMSKALLVFYNESISDLAVGSENYFNQASAIENLRKENKILSEQTLAYAASLRLLKQDAFFANFEPKQDAFAVASATVEGYSALPNLYRVWLQIDSKQEYSTLGLVTPLPNKLDSVACGIASAKGEYWEGYLNGDSKCSYSVYVGANKAPGIMIGRSNNNILVRFIPTWLEIKVGDEVVTSGVDKLFFEGVKVGIVKSISNDNAYTEALIEPYCNPFAPSRYYAIHQNN